MASTWEDLLRIELQAVGENASTWGTKTNDNFERLADAIAGHESISVAGSGNYTISQSDATGATFRKVFLTLTGILTGARVIIIPAFSKTYYIRNATTGGYGITIKTAGGTAATIASAGVTIIVCDGTDCYAAVNAVDRTGDTMTGKLTITSGGLAVDNAVSVSGNATFGGTVSVSGGLHLMTTLSALGAASFGSTVSVSGDATFKGGVSVSGIATFGRTVSVSGIATFKSSISVSGAAVFGGAAGFLSTVSMTGAVSLGSTLAVTGAATFGAAVTVSGALVVVGAATFQGATTVGGAFVANGAASFGAGVSITGGLDLNSTILVDGAAVFNTTLLVGGIVSAASFAGANAIFASGAVEYSGAVSVEASFNVATVTRSAQGNYRIDFTNAAPHIRYAVLITPEATADGNAFIGWYTNRDTAGFNVRITDNSADVAYDPTGFSFIVVLNALS